MPHATFLDPMGSDKVVRRRANVNLRILYLRQGPPRTTPREITEEVWIDVGVVNFYVEVPIGAGKLTAANFRPAKMGPNMFISRTKDALPTAPSLRRDSWGLPANPKGMRRKTRQSG
jgi:hypothetical protein